MLRKNSGKIKEKNFHREELQSNRINYMFDMLIINVFNKAKEEIDSNAITPVSKYIPDILWDRYKYQISDRTLRNYYNKATTTNQDQNLKISLELSQHFSQYLGYEDYYNFILSHKPKATNNYNYKLIFPCFLLFAFFLTSFMFYHKIFISNQNTSYSTENHKKLILYKPYIIGDNLKMLDSTFSYKIIPLDSSRHILFGRSRVTSKETFSLITLEELYITHSDSLASKKEFTK